MKTSETKNRSNGFLGFTNTECEYYPCHTHDDGSRIEVFNCLFCYCPMHTLECPGTFNIIKDADGTVRKDCSGCIIPHHGYYKSWKIVQHHMKKLIPWCELENNTQRVKPKE